MAAKTQSESPARATARRSRRREVSGILLLAGGLFSGLSLMSMQASGEPLMGIGGAAVASGLYGLAGVGSALFVIGMLVAAVRCFRGRPMVEGLREGAGAM